MNSHGSLHATGPERRHKAGFTLIELLVVIAILALLVSILLPALRNAREQGKQVVCMANMRSLGQAFTMYAEEFQGYWPPAVDSLGTQNRWPVPFFNAGIITEELYRYDAAGNVVSLGGPSIFLCPSEMASRTIPNWRNTGVTVDRVEIGGSYSYSEEIHRRVDGDERIDRGTTTQPPFTKPITHCKRTSEVIQLAENFRPIEIVNDKGWRFSHEDFWQGYRSRTGEAVPQNQYADNAKHIGAHHLSRMNVMAMDSHVVASEPMQMEYNDVSWKRWDKWPELPPGGK